VEKVRFYTQVTKLLSLGEEFMVVDLVETTGSVPQAERAKLIVHPDGRTEGTLGGGDLEAGVTTEALRLFSAAPVSLKEYNLADMGMVCGGAVKVLYHHLRPRPEERNFYREVESLCAQGKPFVIVQAIVEGALDSPRLIFSGEGVAAEAGGEFPNKSVVFDVARTILLSDSKKSHVKLSYPEEKAVVYLERVEPQPRLLIFGAGHVGMALAHIAHDLGLFQVEIADERNEFLQEIERTGVRIHKVAPGFAGRLPGVDVRTYVVILTRSHETDFTVLREILRREVEPTYIGVIGSRNKRRALLERLRDDGIPEERLGRVTIPIGLPLGGKDPGEVAISILAQLIRVKNGLGGDDAL